MANTVDTQDWKRGDIVRLKSGGPKMTVCNVVPSSGVHCAWFTNAGECRTEVFPASVLVSGRTRLDMGMDHESTPPIYETSPGNWEVTE